MFQLFSSAGPRWWVHGKFASIQEANDFTEKLDSDGDCFQEGCELFLLDIEKQVVYMNSQSEEDLYNGKTNFLVLAPVLQESTARFLMEAEGFDTSRGGV